MEAHVAECIRDPAKTKRLNSVLVTDGVPSDLQHPSMTKTTEWATLELAKHGLKPKDYLGMSYVVVTENFDIMACYRMMEDRAVWDPGDNEGECDMSNAIYPFVIKALGGANRPVVINIILAANNSDALDRAAEKLLQGAPKQLTDLMDAWVPGRQFCFLLCVFDFFLFAPRRTCLCSAIYRFAEPGITEYLVRRRARLSWAAALACRGWNGSR